MGALASLALVAAAGLVLYGLGRAALGAARLAGRESQRAERAEADAALTKRQSEIMLEDRTTEDAKHSLDRGDF
jgi:hypothetical protein